MEKDKKVLSIVQEDGSVEEVELLVSFKFRDNNKEYIVYTRNEKDESGNITIYVSHFVDKDGQLEMEAVESDEEWSRIKDVLRELSKNND